MRGCSPVARATFAASLALGVTVLSPGFSLSAPRAVTPSLPVPPRGPLAVPGVGRVLQGGSSSCCHSSLPLGANMVTERCQCASRASLQCLPACATAAQGPWVPGGRRGQQKGEFSPWVHGHVNRAASAPQCLSFPLQPRPGQAHPLFPCALGHSRAPLPCPGLSPALPFQELGWLLPPRGAR